MSELEHMTVAYWDEVKRANIAEADAAAVRAERGAWGKLFIEERKRVLVLEARVAKLEAALEFYAQADGDVLILADSGTIARKALRKEGGT